MQTVAEGQEFGPVTDKLIRDLLAAGMRLTAQVADRPEQLPTQLHAYTVEITTALALAVGKLEAAQGGEPDGAPARRRRTARPRNHLSLVPSTDVDGV
jgi:hypothetical protein